MRIYIFLSTWKGSPFGPLSHTELIVDYWLMKTVNINRELSNRYLKYYVSIFIFFSPMLTLWELVLEK